MLQPLGTRAVVKRILPKNQTDSGIYLPDSAKERNGDAEIVSLPFDYEGYLAVGDKVIIGKWSGDDIKHDGNDITIVSIEEITAKVI